MRETREGRRSGAVRVISLLSSLSRKETLDFKRLFHVGRRMLLLLRRWGWLVYDRATGGRGPVDKRRRPTQREIDLAMNYSLSVRR